MIFGTGVDIIEISRFEKLLQKHNTLRHIYGEEELAMLERKNSVQSYAVNFCAKEAFAKALGTGVRSFRLNEVQLLRDGNNRPYYKLSGSAERIAAQFGLVFHVSVTHSGKLAAAFAVAERDELHENRNMPEDERS